MKKFLIVAHYSRFLVQFELNDVRLLQSMGFEVHYATNYQQEDMFSGAIKIIQENGVILHQVDFVRSPYSIPANIKAYRQLKDLMVKEKFSGVHCHTPMAGALARLAANATHTVPVIYTAHGFHFYKGCPLKNKLIYQTAETFLARYTDAQITINQEDFAAAQKFPLRGKAYYVPGIGVDVKKISSVQVDRATKRAELGIPQDAFVFISVGELNENKNHATVVRALAKADIIGAAISTGLSMFITSGMIMNWYYLKKVSLDIVKFWKESFKVIAASMAIMILALLIKKYMSWNSAGLLQLGMQILLFASIYVCMMYKFIMTSEERKQILAFVKRKL